MSGPARLPLLIDASAEALRTASPAFTTRNLYFAVQRARGAPLTEAAFGAALGRRLARGPVPGLLTSGKPRRLARGWDADFPSTVLLVDWPAVADLLTVIAPAGFVVVCLDGTPARVVAWLARGFREGLRAPVLYLHDATTVVYPFAIEPLATLVRHREALPMVYRDLGLPPLGATARRFGDPALPGDEPILDLEAIPPATLLRYCTKAALGLAGE